MNTELLTVDLIQAPSGWSAEDKIRVLVTAHLSLADRILMLWGRPLAIDVEVWTEKAPGKTEARTEVWATVPRWPWRRRRGHEAK
jgi:hypothetical protein